MDIYRLNSDLKFVNQIGQTLSLDERLKLELALIKLNETEAFDQILFWGRINGITKDYYIAEGIYFKNKYEFPLKKFFYCNDSFIFAELPPLISKHKAKVDEIRSYFSGQHDKVLITEIDPDNPTGNAPPAEEEQEKDPLNDSLSEPELKEEKINLTELDRLSYVINSIEIDCSLVPVGALKLTPTHEIRYDDHFKGLSIKDANNLDNYMHFRQPLTQEKKDYICLEDTIFKGDFFDPLTSDVIKGCWSIQSDSSKTQVTIRSLLWPGFIAYHRANSNSFGYAYMGNGIKNDDLAFLLQFNKFILE